MKKEAGIVVESFDPFFPGAGAAKSINAFKINLPVSVFPDPVSPLRKTRRVESQLSFNLFSHFLAKTSFGKVTHLSTRL